MRPAPGRSTASTAASAGDAHHLRRGAGWRLRHGRGAADAGFVAKELLYEGALGAAGIGLAMTLAALLGNGLMAAAAAAVALKPFLGKRGDGEHAHEGPLALWLGPLLLGGVGLAIGVLTGLTGSAIVGPVASVVLGRVVNPHLHLIPGHISTPLILSLATYGPWAR